MFSFPNLEFGAKSGATTGTSTTESDVSEDPPPSSLGHQRQEVSVFADEPTTTASSSSSSSPMDSFQSSGAGATSLSSALTQAAESLRSDASSDDAPDHPLREYFSEVLKPQGDSIDDQIWSTFLTGRYRTLNFSPHQLQPPPPSFLLVDPQRFMEGCFVRGAMAGSAGYGLGVMLGGFFFSMQHVDTTQYTHLSTAEQVKLSYRGFGSSCTRMARNFSKVGMVYSMSECLIEKERGCHEMANAIYAGCATGGFLAMHGGPGAMATGCLGFAAFSAAIESFMGHY